MNKLCLAVKFLIGIDFVWTQKRFVQLLKKRNSICLTQIFSKEIYRIHKATWPISTGTVG